LDNLTAIELTIPTISLSAGINGKNASDDNDPPPIIEYQQSINNFCGGSERYTAMYCIVLLLNQVLPGQSLQSVILYNFTNMQAMP
jgi:hypothetical protein